MLMLMLAHVIYQLSTPHLRTWLNCVASQSCKAPGRCTIFKFREQVLGLNWAKSYEKERKKKFLFGTTKMLEQKQFCFFVISNHVLFCIYFVRLLFRKFYYKYFWQNFCSSLTEIDLLLKTLNLVLCR